jgi:hypothetical protein
VDVWRRLRAEPPKLRAAIARRNQRQLVALVGRLQHAVSALATATALATAGPDAAYESPERYERLAKVAPRYNVNPKTLRRWLDQDAPDALLRQSRLTLVDKVRLAEWDARRRRAAS